MAIAPAGIEVSNPYICTDAVAYAALLRNELLGAGIETVPDPHTDDRRQAILSQEIHSLFRVRPSKNRCVFITLLML